MVKNAPKLVLIIQAPYEAHNCIQGGLVAPLHTRAIVGNSLISTAKTGLHERAETDFQSPYESGSLLRLGREETPDQLGLIHIGLYDLLIQTCVDYTEYSI